MIEAGRVPFEPTRRRSRKDATSAQKDARGRQKSLQGEPTEQRSEVQPELSVEKTLVFLVRLSDVKLEPAAREQLCAWLRMDSREGRSKD